MRLPILLSLLLFGCGGDSNVAPVLPAAGSILIVDGDCDGADVVYYADPTATAPPTHPPHGVKTIAWGRTFTSDPIDCYLPWYNGNSGYIDLEKAIRFAGDNLYRSVTFGWAVGIVIEGNASLKAAVDYAVSQGVRVYAASGNDGKEISFPNNPNVFVVGCFLQLCNTNPIDPVTGNFLPGPVDMRVGHRSTSFATVQAAAQLL